MARLRLDVDDLPEGEARVVPVPDGRPPFQSLVVARTGEGLRAYWNVCQHIPVPLDSGTGIVGPGDLVCLTHGARYRPEDGYCTAGPCSGTRLIAVPVETSDDGAFAVYDPDVS